MYMTAKERVGPNRAGGDSLGAEIRLTEEFLEGKRAKLFSPPPRPKTPAS